MEITRGLLCSMEDYKSLLLSNDLPELYPDSSTLLIVYAIYPTLTRITCYPITGKTIWKLSLTLTSSSPELLQKITKQLNPSKLIHTTGLSEKGGKFIVENYISPHQSRLDPQAIIRSLKEIPSVEACSIQKISKK